jgi:hypothetical protein
LSGGGGVEVLRDRFASALVWTLMMILNSQLEKYFEAHCGRFWLISDARS